MIPCNKLSTASKITLGFVSGISVIFWGIGCMTYQQWGFATSWDRFYNARLVRNFTRNLADGVEASCRDQNMAKHLRTLAQDIDDAINIYIGLPGDDDRVINAINAAAKLGRSAWDEMKDCGGIPPEVPRIPGYYETFWDIAS